MSTSPARIFSTMVCAPSGRSSSDTLYTCSHGMPLRRSTSAVPIVASTRKPRSASRLTGKISDRLSLLATETNTEPEVGSDP